MYGNEASSINVKDIINMLFWIVTVFSTIFTINRAITDAKERRRQTNRELRVQQNALARDVISELRKDPMARNALQALDWNVFPDENGTLHRLENPDLSEILSRKSEYSIFEKRVRDSFDTLFDYIELLAHYEEEGLVDVKDAEYQFAHYLYAATNHARRIGGFLQAFHYDKTYRLLNKMGAKFDATAPAARGARTAGP